MSAQVIDLWHGPYERRMRRPHEPPPHPITGEATVIILPVIRLERPPSPPLKPKPRAAPRKRKSP